MGLGPLVRSPPPFRSKNFPILPPVPPSLPPSPLREDVLFFAFTPSFSPLLFLGSLLSFSLLFAWWVLCVRLYLLLGAFPQLMLFGTVAELLLPLFFLCLPLDFSIFLEKVPFFAIIPCGSGMRLSISEDILLPPSLVVWLRWGVGFFLGGGFFWELGFSLCFLHRTCYLLFFLVPFSFLDDDGVSFFAGFCPLLL